LKLTIPATFAAERLVDEFMNVRELADFAKVEPSIIYAACAKHELKFIRPGRLYKFKKQDILEWLDTCHNPNDNRSSVVNVDEYVEKYLQKNVLKG
jgi:excisionase family DNA binding protein